MSTQKTVPLSDNSVTEFSPQLTASIFSLHLTDSVRTNHRDTAGEGRLMEGRKAQQLSSSPDQVLHRSTIY